MFKEACCECHGSGLMPCPKCSGTGTFTYLDSRGSESIVMEELCPDCWGSGETKCTFCEGEGYFYDE